ncbi:MAG: Do family serine endopeptidase [Spirochaeta sp.]|jgi:Do/DeqQ family serine protease|nr:Do family serine endopeptidase [Spirochaeta sp.]
MKTRKSFVLRNVITGALVLALGIGGGMLGAGLAGGSETANLTAAGGSQAEHILASDTQAGTPAAYSADDSSAVARSFQEQFRRVSAETLPVVAEINVVNRVTRQTRPNPFEFFFGDPRQAQPREQEREMRGMGSGVIVGREGDTVYVLTNNHVAGEADEIEVVLNDGRSFDGELVGGDELIDLAMLSFETHGEVPIARLGNSDSLQAGDWVFAVGNPLGFQSSITAGIVSATARSANGQAGMSGVTDYIQTDAAINRGNSGGALVNLDGEVVGINTWIASNSGGSIGLGFAIPVNNARRAITDFIETGEVAYSWLGVQVSTLDSETAGEFLGSPGAQIDPEDTRGAFVSAIYDDSPAARSGIRPGDLIIAVNGTPISNSNELVRNVAGLTPGDSVPFEVIRNGEQQTITVKTGRRDDTALADATLWPGMSVAPITEQIRGQLELSDNTDGVIVAGVAGESRARQSGIRRGDVIQAINGRRIETIHDFYTVLSRVDEEEVQFRVLRDGQQLILGFVRPTA